MIVGTRLQQQELKVSVESTGRGVARWAALILALAVLWTSSLWAQSASTGALSGTVRDTMGAAIPDAAVVLINFATGQTQTTTTTLNGTYGFSQLSPGEYELRFSAEGFQTSRMPSVLVNVSEDSVVDATMEAGATTEPVLCQCSVANSTSSSTGTLVDSKAITSIPLTSRNFTQVMSAASGAAADVNNAGILGRGNQTVNVNGNSATGTFTIDGAVSGAAPNPDSIVQFRIQTSQYDSGYGAYVPNTNLITKPGSNEFHGVLWEFIRNDIFNANAFFQNAAGQPKPNLKQNQFGGAVGGPIRANKLFFFGSYQGTRQINGLDPTALSTMLQPPLTDDRSPATIGAQFCPGNKPAADQPRYNTFAGGVQVACDGSNINPIALGILQRKLPDGTFLIPTPQRILTDGTNAGLGFSSYSLPSAWNEDQYLANLDQVISKKHTLAGRFFVSDVNSFRTFGSPLGLGLPFTPGAPQAFESKDYVASLKLSSVLSRTVVNEVRMTFSRGQFMAVGVDVPTATSLGMVPVDPFFDTPPEITVQGSLGVFRFFGNSNNNFTNLTDTYQWSDNISWIHGAHTLRTGVFINTALGSRLDTGQARGKVTFQNFTDFLIGQDAAHNLSPTGLSNVDFVVANQGTGPQGEVQYLNRTYYGSVFVQDDFKLSPRFTVNLGLRWEYISPSLDTAGQIGNVWPSLLSQAPIPPLSGTYVGNTVASNYDPSTINPYTGLAFGPPPEGVFIRPNKTMYQNSTPLDTFAPRFGFAWQPGSKQRRLAVRGGYGWFFQPTAIGGNAPNTPLFTAQPFAQGFSNTSTSNNLSTLQKPFPTTTLGFQLRTPTSQLSDRVGGPDYMIPTVQQWNLNMQFTLFPTLTLDIGYVGSFGTHLLISQGLNQPVLASASNPVNCGYNGGDPADLANCITTNTSRNAALRVPFLGETPTALASNEYVGLSRYHGLQTTLRKDLTHGLTFRVSYTYSKAQNDNVRMNDQNNRSINWARASFDRTHRMIFNYNYEVPNLITAKGFASTLLSGWSLSGVTSIQSGTPLTLTDRRGGSVYGRAGTATITLCPGVVNADLATSGRNQDRLNAWFNAGPTIICAPPTVGSDSPAATGYGNTGQGIVTGPGQFVWDISFGKFTRVGGIREDAQLQFRAEFYNAFNHPQFSNPGTAFGPSNFGVITQTSVAPRLIQFGLKYLF